MTTLGALLVEILVHELAPLLDYDSYCALRTTCRRMRAVLPPRDEDYYWREHGLRVRRKEYYTNVPVVYYAFCDATGCRRPDGPCQVWCSFYAPGLCTYRSQKPYIDGVNTECLLSRPGEYVLNRQWRGYVLGVPPPHEPGDAVLCRDSLLCTHQQRVIVYAKYCNSRGLLHHSHGPAWFNLMPQRKLKHKRRGASAESSYTFTTRAWAEEYWYDGQPRAGPQPWRVLYFANGNMREAWYFNPQDEHDTMHRFDLLGQVAITKRMHRSQRVYRLDSL